MRPKPFFPILFALICTTLHAEVKLHALFGNQMVLQSRNTIRLHGAGPTVARVESGAALQN